MEPEPQVMLEEPGPQVNNVNPVEKQDAMLLEVAAHMSDHTPRFGRLPPGTCMLAYSGVSTKRRARAIDYACMRSSGHCRSGQAASAQADEKDKELKSWVLMWNGGIEHKKVNPEEKQAALHYHYLGGHCRCGQAGPARARC